MEINNNNVGNVTNFARSLEVLKDNKVGSVDEIFFNMLTSLVDIYYGRNKDFCKEDLELDGLITSCVYGSSILLLLNNMKIKKDGEDYKIEIDKITEDHQGNVISTRDKLEINSLVDEAEKAIKEIFKNINILIENEGYSFSPFIKSTYNDLIKQYIEFISPNNKTMPVEPMSWVFTFMIQLRRNTKGMIGYDQKIKLGPEEQDIVIGHIEDILKCINSTSLVDEDSKNVVGWNFIEGCDRPSVYYTTIVIEMLSDFKDYIIVGDEYKEFYEQDTVLINKIDESFLGTSTTGSFILSSLYGEYNPDVEGLNSRNGKFYEIGFHYWRKYAEGDNSISDGKLTFGSHYKNIDTYYYFYIIEVLILTYVDSNKKLVEKYGEEELKQLVTDSIENGLYYANQMYKKADQYTDGNYIIESFGNFKIKRADHLKDKETKKEAVKRYNSIKSILSQHSILGTSLSALKIRVNVIYTSFISQYPDKEMSNELSLVLDEKNDNYWVWDKIGLNVKITEQVIEALVEFRDYFEQYEYEFIKTNQENVEKTQKAISAKEAELRERLEKEYKEKLEKTEIENKKKWENDHKIDYELRKLIREELEDYFSGDGETAEGFFLSLIKEFFINTNNKYLEDPDDDDVKKISERFLQFAAVCLHARYAGKKEKENKVIEEGNKNLQDDFDSLMQCIYDQNYKAVKSVGAKNKLTVKFKEEFEI